MIKATSLTGKPLFFSACPHFRVTNFDVHMYTIVLLYCIVMSLVAYVGYAFQVGMCSPLPWASWFSTTSAIYVGLVACGLGTPCRLVCFSHSTVKPTIARMHPAQSILSSKCATKEQIMREHVSLNICNVCRNSDIVGLWWELALVFHFHWAMTGVWKLQIWRANNTLMESKQHLLNSGQDHLLAKGEGARGNY